MKQINRRDLKFFALAFLAFATPVHASETPFFRGMTISCHGWGESWETPEMETTIRDLKSMGVNSIAIHPYARIQNDGSLEWTPKNDPNQLAKPFAWARENGMRVMLVPHIAPWGTPWLWRGEIEFDSVEGWNRFFHDYEKWIVEMAILAERQGAVLFCIGLEYGKTQKFDQRWREIIASIRKVYTGKITYGANWDEINKVPFWDALDYIGVLAYFPLTKEPNPSKASLRAAWRPWLDQLDALSAKVGKPVIFTEVGYHEYSKAASEPWTYQRTGGEHAREIQVRCMETALELEQSWPILSGIFLWKWFPGTKSEPVETFDLRAPWMRESISKTWLHAR